MLPHTGTSPVTPACITRRKRAVSGCLGVQQQLLGGPLLRHGSVAHEHHAVGDLLGEAQLVGGDEHGQPVLAGEPADHLEDFVDEFRVEGRGRLVQQQHPRARRQRPGDGHPLLLAAGQVPRQRVRPVREADPFQQLDRALRSASAAGIPCTHRSGPATFSSAVRWLEEVEVLEDHAHSDLRAGPRATRGGQRPAVLPVADTAAADQDRTRVRVLQVVDAAQQGALAGPAGAEQGDDLAGPYGHVQPVEYDLLPVPLVQAGDLDGAPRRQRCGAVRPWQRFLRQRLGRGRGHPRLVVGHGDLRRHHRLGHRPADRRSRCHHDREAGRSRSRARSAASCMTLMPPVRTRYITPDAKKMEKKSKVDEASWVLRRVSS